MKNPLIDVILFDLGSTLIYFDGHVPEIMAQAYNELATSLHEGGYHWIRISFFPSFFPGWKPTMPNAKLSLLNTPPNGSCE